MKKFYFLIGLIAILAGCAGEQKESVYTGVVEGTTVQVPALTGGKLVWMAVQTGDAVDAGDTLAVVDSSDFHLQMQEVLAGFRELAVQRELARTALRSAEADLRYIQQKYDRLKLLVEQQTAPEQQLDDLANQLTRLKFARQRARQSMIQLDARKEQLLAKKAQLEKKIRDCTIVAPVAGTITNCYYEEGEAAMPLSPVVELLQLNNVEVKIYVAEKRLPSLKTGQTVTVRVDGLDQTLHGKISWINPEAEFTPKTILTPETRSSLVYAVKIKIDNKEGYLKHRMPVEVVL